MYLTCAAGNRYFLKAWCNPQGKDSKSPPSQGFHVNKRIWEELQAEVQRARDIEAGQDTLSITFLSSCLLGVSST